MEGSEYEAYAAEISSLEEKIRSLEADINRQAQVLAARNELINEHEHTISQQKATNNRQQDEINEKAHQIADLERANHQYESAEVYLKNQNDSLTSVRDALVTFLHEIANEAEQAEEPNALADNIDDRLEELGLPSRKKRFEMVFTVPVRLRVEGDYVSKEEMREAFERGTIGWTVTDYEDTLEDDLEVVEITEVPQ